MSSTKRIRALVVTKPKSAVAKLSSKVKRLEKKVSGVELKSLDWISEKVALGLGTWTTNNMTYIPAGDGNSQRTGRQITAKALQCHLRMVSVTQSNMSFRVIILQDLQQVGDTVPSMSRYLENDGRIESLKKWSDSTSFKCHYDKTFTQNVSFLNQDICLDKKIYLKLPNIRVVYNGDANTDIQKNGIYIYVMARFADLTSANEASASPTDTYYNIRARLIYSDL